MTSTVSWATLSWTIETIEGGSRVRLRGAITETSDFGPLLLLPAGSKTVLDLEGITRINSCGVREWMGFIQGIAKQHAVALERCSVAIVQQLNMIKNFAGGAEIRSAYAPYYCGTCERSHDQLFELDDSAWSSDLLPCPSCGSSTELDDVPSAYWGFRAAGKGSRAT